MRESVLRRIVVVVTLFLLSACTSTPQPSELPEPVREGEPKLTSTVVISPSMDLGGGTPTQTANSPLPTATFIEIEETGDKWKSWEIFSTLYSIPYKPISKITIEHEYWNDFDSFEHTFLIRNTGAGYRTATGKWVEEEKIDGFLNSLVNLHHSGGKKSCFTWGHAHLDFSIEIEYSDGQVAHLTTSSICDLQRNPWNVSFEGKNYFQASGEIPLALYELLASFHPDLGEWWSSPLTATGFDSYGDSFRFLLTGGVFPREKFEFPTFEDDLTEELVANDRVIQSFLDYYGGIYIVLFCNLGTDCTTLEARMGVDSQGGVGYLFDAQITAGVPPFVEPDIKLERLIEFDQYLLSNGMIQGVKNIEAVRRIRVECWEEPECSQVPWCSSPLTRLGKNPSPDEMVCSVQFPMGEAKTNTFYYIPSADVLWVYELTYNLYKDIPKHLIMSEMWRMDTTPLEKLFATPGFESFFLDYGTGFEIVHDPKGCNQIILSHDIKWLFEYLPELNNTLEHLDVNFRSRTIEVAGLCAFFDSGGNLVLVEPEQSAKD